VLPIRFVCCSDVFVLQAIHKVCWFVDFLGIIAGMLFSGFGFLYFCYYCHHDFVKLWSLFIVILCTFLVGWVWMRLNKRLSAKVLLPCDRFPEFSFTLCFFITFASFIPLFGAWLLLAEVRTNPQLGYLLAEATGSDLLVSVGVFVFAQGGVPERFFRPNILDMLGHSHQIWHVITAAVMFLLTKNSVGYYLARSNYRCE
jgi:predicted membrane channel-forming protein YqfA (hemolysin III family)